MLAFLTNLGLPELLVILVIAVLIFGKDLPQAASKAYMQARKLRNAVDDLRRDSGIERELRDIERNVREAEWEARKQTGVAPLPPPGTAERPYVRPIPGPASLPPAPPVVDAEVSAAGDATPAAPEVTGAESAEPAPPRPTDAAS